MEQNDDLEEQNFNLTQKEKTLEERVASLEALRALKTFKIVQPSNPTI